MYKFVFFLLKFRIFYVWLWKLYLFIVISYYVCKFGGNIIKRIKVCFKEIIEKKVFSKKFIDILNRFK